jgi:hypothetical protein
MTTVLFGAYHTDIRFVYMPKYIILSTNILMTVGRDSSVGVSTRYGLDGPGIESRWGARFSAPGPTKPPNNGHRVIPGGKAAGAWH